MMRLQRAERYRNGAISPFEDEDEFRGEIFMDAHKTSGVASVFGYIKLSETSRKVADDDDLTTSAEKLKNLDAYIDCMREFASCNTKTKRSSR